MALTIHVDIVSAEEEIFSGSARYLTAPCEMGELGILPNHVQLLTLVKLGQVKLTLENGEVEIFYVSGGILEVQPFNITILADTAARAEDLDEVAAIAAKEKAEQALQDRNMEVDYSIAMAELARAQEQLKTIAVLRKKLKSKG